MSRCFPFPPPGYEKKTIDDDDDANLIIKEKDKQHTRKDKESGRKRIEKSEDRHEVDKRKKRKKHRDKKDKKKDRIRASEGSKVVLSLDDGNGEKLTSDCKPVIGVQDTRVLTELGKRVGNDGGEIDNQIVRLSFMDHEGPNSLEKVAKNDDGLLADNKDRRGSENAPNRPFLKVDAKVGYFSGGSQRRVEVDFCESANIEKRKEWNDKSQHGKNEDQESEYKNEDHQKNRIAERKRENEKKAEKKRKRKRKEENVSVIDRSIVKIKPVANGLQFLDFHNNIPSNPLKEGYASHVKLPKHKELIANGFLHEDGIRPSDISKLASSTLRVCGNENGSQYCKTLAVEEGSYQNSNGEFSSSQSVIINVKNMALRQNGCISTFENGRGPVTNHVFGNGSISSKYVDNGRKVEVEPCDANMEDVRKVEYGRKFVEPGIYSCKLPDSLKKNTSSNHSAASVRIHDNGGSSVKPHPDSDYLSQILTVPTLEWPQSDDQEWLFGSRNSQRKRTRLASTLVDCTKQVWAIALPLDSADVTALPFVIPY